VKLGLPLALVAAIGLAPSFPFQIQGRPSSSTETAALLIGQVVDAETGQPVSDATVTLEGRPKPAAKPDAPAASGNLFDFMMMARGQDREERLEATADGRFVFRNLPVSKYSVTATAPGYLRGDADFARAGGSASFEIRAGQTNARATIRLWKQAVITGVVFDEAGEPVIRARVHAYLRGLTRFGTLSWDQSGTGTTDDRGRYRIAGLKPGPYVVVIPQEHSTAPAAMAENFMQSLLGGTMPEGGLGSIGDAAASVDPRAIRVGAWRVSADNVQAAVRGDGVMQAYRTLFHPAATSLSDATFVIVQPGEERDGVDFALQPVVTARISGKVTGPNGPVASVPIRLVPAGDRRPPPGFDDVASGVTSADGQFMLLAVPPGQYRVIAAREPPQDFMSELPDELASNPFVKMAMGMRGAGAQPLFGEIAVTVAPGDVLDVAIAVSEGVKVSGRLSFEGTPAPDPKALKTASVQLSALDAAQTRSYVAKVDAEGQFKLNGVTPGRYRVQSWIFLAETTWLVKPGAGADDVQLVVGDQDTSGVVVTLTNQLGTLRGTVRQRSTPATGAAPRLTAVLVPANYTTWTDPEVAVQKVHFEGVAETNTFSFAMLLPGEYFVAVVDETQLDPGRGLALLRAIAAQATRVTITVGEGNAVSVAVVNVR
jgi:hypothetical protein